MLPEKQTQTAQEQRFQVPPSPFDLSAQNFQQRALVIVVGALLMLLSIALASQLPRESEEQTIPAWTDSSDEEEEPPVEVRRPRRRWVTSSTPAYMLQSLPQQPGHPHPADSQEPSKSRQL